MKPIIINVEPYMIGSKIIITVENSNNETTDRNNFSHDCCHHCENTNSLAANEPTKLKDSEETNKILKKENENLKKKQKELNDYIKFLEKKCKGLHLYIELLDRYYKDDFSGDFWKTASKFTEFLRIVKNEKSFEPKN